VRSKTHYAKKLRLKMLNSKSLRSWFDLYFRKC